MSTACLGGVVRLSAAGFTGTRKGLTWKQRGSLYLLLERTHPAWLHHGDCQGADAEAHELAGRLRIRRIVHPPADNKLRAFCPSVPGLDGLERSPLPYLKRDRVIVEETSWLIACPEGMERKQGSGTWYTIDFARSKERMVVFVWPDGTIEIDGWRDAL